MSVSQSALISIESWHQMPCQFYYLLTLCVDPELHQKCISFRQFYLRQHLILYWHQHRIILNNAQRYTYYTKKTHWRRGNAADPAALMFVFI